MNKKSITVNFDLDSEIEKRVYSAIKNLTGFYEEPDLSKSLITFINDMVLTVSDCEKRSENCEALLRKIIGKHGWN